ncbi:MAG: hypothetical protein ABUT39_20915 [Acidobacteriota bacterium]
MKQVSLRELHEKTGALVREPGARPRTDQPFKRRRILPAYQEMLDSGALRGGTDSTQIVSEGRDGR